MIFKLPCIRFNIKLKQSSSIIHLKLTNKKEKAYHIVKMYEYLIYFVYTPNLKSWIYFCILLPNYWFSANYVYQYIISIPNKKFRIFIFLFYLYLFYQPTLFQNSRVVVINQIPVFGKMICLLKLTLFK